MTILLFHLAILVQQPDLIFQFNPSSSADNWRIVDDVVMGGRSSGQFDVNPEGFGRFHGYVSLENNGGFSSVRHRLNRENISPESYIQIRLKGDGKEYQFRVRSKDYDRYSYITYFTTTDQWQDVRIKLSDMYPSFRGRKLDMPNFDKDEISEIAFLIANKREESFELLIDRIELIHE